MSAIRLPNKLMDVTSSMSKKEALGFSRMTGLSVSSKAVLGTSTWRSTGWSWCAKWMKSDWALSSGLNLNIAFWNYIKFGYQFGHISRDASSRTKNLALYSASLIRVGIVCINFMLHLQGKKGRKNVLNWLRVGWQKTPHLNSLGHVKYLPFVANEILESL